ncbi:MAG TPA: hypothetical protein DDW98_12870 [Gammaproteobacteria bacterium]|nr:hypothetical protein [Gammaproteobacteria bacterium]
MQSQSARFALPTLIALPSLAVRSQNGAQGIGHLGCCSPYPIDYGAPIVAGSMVWLRRIT